MTVTFFTAANSIASQFNYLLAIILVTLLLSSSGILNSIYKKHQLLMIISAMFGLWFLVGLLLCCINDTSFVTDWINSAVAIGTIGTVWVALYLANKKPNPYNYIHVNSVTLKLYKLSNMNMVDIAYQITNLTDFKIKISRVSIQTKQFKLFDNFTLNHDHDNGWDKLKARKTFHGESNLGWLNDSLQFDIELPDDIISELLSAKSSNISFHLNTNTFDYKLTPKKIKHYTETIQCFEANKIIELTF